MEGVLCIFSSAHPLHQVAGGGGGQKRIGVTDAAMWHHHNHLLHSHYLPHQREHHFG